MGVRVYSIFFPLFFFLREKNGRINWKNSKEILSIFLINFLSFFFLKTLLPFSFWEGEWRGKRIEGIAFWRIKEIYKNIVFFSNAFLGRKIRQKIHILCQKYA